MLASIHPLGERARNSNYWITAVAYAVGSMAGGAAVGAVMGGLGRMLLPDLTATTLAVIAAVIAAAGVAVDLGFVRLPTWHRQVNEDWLTTYRGWVYGAGFGFQLGMGLVTIVTTASIYATFALSFLSGDLFVGSFVGVVFGLSRSLVIFTVARVTTPDSLRELHRSMQRRAALAQRLVVGAQALLLVVSLGVIVWR